MMRKIQVVVLIFTIMALVSSISRRDPMEPAFRLCASKYNGSIGVIGCDQFSPDLNYPITINGKKIVIVHRCCLVCSKGSVNRRICLTSTLYQAVSAPFTFFPDNVYTQTIISE